MFISTILNIVERNSWPSIVPLISYEIKVISSDGTIVSLLWFWFPYGSATLVTVINAYLLGQQLTIQLTVIGLIYPYVMWSMSRMVSDDTIQHQVLQTLQAPQTVKALRFLMCDVPMIEFAIIQVTARIDADVPIELNSQESL